MSGMFTPEDLWIIATCACCAVACSVPGVFLMLRRSSMLGDAVSHAILPGLAVAFIISGSREPFIMVVGALAAGLLTSFLSSLLHRTTIIKEDSSLGVVFTTFFAVGVILIGMVARQVDLDPGCVLYGLAEFTPFDTIRVGGYYVPRSFVWLSLNLIGNVALVTVFYKELKLSTFDPGLATTLGFNVSAIHYALMTCVTITAVAAFEAVGSILVVSMLITPAAAAYLLSNRLSGVLFLAALLGACSAVFGYGGALYLNTSVAGMMSVTSGAMFVLALLFSPSHGYVRKVLVRGRMQQQIARDDILGMLFRWHEVVGKEERQPLHLSEITAALDRGMLTRFALRSLERSGDVVQLRDGSLRLTERGIVEASALVRSHRLWETYLAKHLGLPIDHLHDASERTEHFIGRALAREIEQEVSAAKDPHGRTIPKA
jgi:manganese/zinc/iron transport system permease protein